VPDIPDGFGQPLLGYAEPVGPVLNFVRLQEADAALVLRTLLREIVGHDVLSNSTVNAIVSRRVPTIQSESSPVSQLVLKARLSKPTIRPVE
jgi:hypothetical protein